MHRRWVAREVESRARETLSRALGVPSLLASVLTARGMTDAAEAAAFLNPSLGSLPDPDLLAGMDAAAERLSRAALTGETVWLYTDYDVDGVTSAALLSLFFAAAGISHRVRLPRRDREGYGLHGGALREIAEQGGSLVVTADCGTAAVSQARLAHELGLDLVITDHHQPGPELPQAVAVVNPKLPTSRYPDSMLAGVGVAWNLVAGVRRRLREGGYFLGDGPAEPDIRQLLDLVALGTVADVAPLQQVNRTLVAFGLEALNRCPRRGVNALKEVAGVRGPLRAGHLGFQLGPRLNAAGRMEGPHQALDLLLGEDPAEVQELARFLDGLNRSRQAEERGIVDAAVRRVEEEGWWPQRWSLVVDGDGWHPGVIGIVASRLVERFHRPAVVLAVVDGTAKGSARSIRGLDLCAALGECGELLTRYGGHAAAAGLELPLAQVGAFRERFEGVVRSKVAREDLQPVLFLDAEVTFQALDLDSVRELTRLEPTGFGNPAPRFLARGVRVLDVLPIGRGGDHLRFRLEQDGIRLTAIAWRANEALGQLSRGAEVDLAFGVQVDAWGGVERVRLDVEGMRPCQEAFPRR